MVNYWIIYTLCMNNVFANVVIGKIVSSNLEQVKINEHSVKNQSELFWGDKIENESSNFTEVLIYPSLYIKIKAKSAILFNATKIEQNDKNLKTKNLIKVLKGGLIAEQFKLDNSSITTKISTRRSISSVRGTILEVNNDSEEEIHLYEGKVDVLDIKSAKIIPIVENNTLSSNFKITNENKATPSFPTKNEIENMWSESAKKVLDEHRKNAKELQASFEKEVNGFVSEINKEASKMYKDIGGVYDKPKK